MGITKTKTNGSQLKPIKKLICQKDGSTSLGKLDYALPQDLITEISSKKNVKDKMIYYGKLKTTKMDLLSKTKLEESWKQKKKKKKKNFQKKKKKKKKKKKS